MTKRSKRGNRGTMLELWRPPKEAGDPVGCITTTYTFDPSLFDEQCLARFLGIGSEPDREDVAFLLERETRLGGIYAGVLVDHTNAGVEHSLRWDVLAVRARSAKQHAKVSLLAWSNRVRLIVASANLTEAGYRRNFEVASSVDFTAEECDAALLESALKFMESVLGFVPGGSDRQEVKRAGAFLSRIASLCADWSGPPRTRTIRRVLACTVPGRGTLERSALAELMDACRSRGGLPYEAWVASPFFDVDDQRNLAAEALCKQLARGRQRYVRFCVPASQGEGPAGIPRLSAPQTLLHAAAKYDAKASVAIVPSMEGNERRDWHAKMFYCEADDYSALMIGSSNMTAAGLGLIPSRNLEANLVTLVDSTKHGREEGSLKAAWVEMETVPDPEDAEWLGTAHDEESDAAALKLPAGFLSAAYHAGDRRRLVIALDPTALPDSWMIEAVGRSSRGSDDHGIPVLEASDWTGRGRPPSVEVEWSPADPPARLRVIWDQHAAFLPLNVHDAGLLPAPAILRDMTAEEMLVILAASDPGAALRVWQRRHASSADLPFDADLDSATPVDLDPLHLHELSTTFLHRIRRRARIMAQLRLFVERPAINAQSLDWRLRGLIGIEALARKFADEFDAASKSERGGADPREALLTLADLLIVLRSARYSESEGAIPKAHFERVYRPFVAELAHHLGALVRPSLESLPADIAAFWSRTVAECGT